jgi:hypothetical protein
VGRVRTNAMHELPPAMISPAGRSAAPPPLNRCSYGTANVTSIEELVSALDEAKYLAVDTAESYYNEAVSMADGFAWRRVFCMTAAAIHPVIPACPDGHALDAFQPAPDRRFVTWL